MKFTAREVIGVLKARILSLTAQLTKERQRRTALETQGHTEANEWRLKAARLQNELNEKNGVIESYAKGALSPTPVVPPQTVPRSFTILEICHFFNVKPADVYQLADAMRNIPPGGNPVGVTRYDSLGVVVQPKANVAVGAVDADVLSGRRYGEFITVNGFAPDTIPAPGEYGYEQRAYYVTKRALDNTPGSESLILIRADGVDLNLAEADGEEPLIPVVLTVLR